ncbi:MAG: hypothetical protein K9J81_04245 [Desulfohalobiaceae bacterium]|nr:hypothetical protein [Desulfohalobiaceae bacterium]
MANDTATVERVDRLEEIMMQVAYEHTKTEMELRSLSREMKDFKREMRDFKQEMSGFKQEMSDFKQEMSGFKQEMLASKKENDRRWGDLVNKLGTLVEDIVAPSLPRIVKDDFGFADIDRVLICLRVRDKRKGTVAEFDAILVAGDTVFINETKSRPRQEHVDEFLDKLQRIDVYLPEYAGMERIPLFSSLAIPEDLLQYLSKNGIYALGMGEDVMEVLNLEQVKARSRQ